MKIKLLTILTLGLACSLAQADDATTNATPSTAAPSPFKDDDAKLSYAAGMSVGKYYQRQELPLNADEIPRGIKDVLSGGKALLTEEEMRQVLMESQQKARAKAEEKRHQQAAENKKKSDEFLAGNKSKSGVVALDSGLQYKVLTEGKGESPKSSDNVTVNYRGTLLDGTEFDSSIKRGQPASFPVTGVIKGWTEALLKMSPGAKWELFIPPDLAYGEGGRPGIPPNSLLIFEVELISTETPKPPAPAAPLTSDIIKVPSLEEMKKGAKIETIKADQIEAEVKKAAASTNQ